ncbi:MAG: conjugal transfer protein TraH [Sulfuritalea sp.]|nr:conjugal transfer protein TraH [Sulfuritalea sp.]
MFTRRFRRNAAAAMIGMSLTMPWLVHANMKDAMDNMFVSITNPGSYRSQNRMGAVGGYASIRMPNQNINVLTLDVPRISMGCGGIDMFGGSFSFINADRLIAVMRNIGQIAVAALFKLAIAAISKELSVNMSEFLGYIQWLNNIKLNSCKIGEFLGGQMAKGMQLDAETAGQNQEKIDAAKGRVPASFDVWFKGQFGDNFAKVTADPDNPFVGNMTWRALYRSGTYERVYVGSDPALAAMLIINIGGTEIVKLDTPSKKQCESAPDTPLCTQTPDNVKRRLTMAMLTAPTENDVLASFTNTSLTDEFGWLTMTEKKLTDTDMFPGGTTALAYKILFGTTAVGAGTQAELDAAPADPRGGIFYYITNGTWGDFPEAERYLTSMTAPMLRLLVMVQRDPEAVKYIATKYAPILATSMAVQLATELANAAQQAFKGDIASKVHVPDGYYENIEAFRRDIADYRAKQSEALDMDNKMHELTTRVAQSLGSGSLSLPSNTGRR